MGSLLHSNAKTTPKIRKEIQDSKESIAKIAARYNLNPKTVVKWRKSSCVEDKKSGSVEGVFFAYCFGTAGGMRVPACNEAAIG